jgi:predicted DNA-binding transcriptional regulator AlpA
MSSKISKNRLAAQGASAKKAAAPKTTSGALTPELIEANNEAKVTDALAAKTPPQRRHDPQHIHAARAPPPHLPRVRLLDKAEILAITNVSFVTIWTWMRAGTFPRSRMVGGKSMWLSTEIEAWLGALPVRPLKGDDDGHGQNPAGSGTNPPPSRPPGLARLASQRSTEDAAK